MVKVTYTLDDETVGAIRQLAEQRGKPQSLIVREAVAAYASRDRKLDADDRARRLQVLDRLADSAPTRPRVEVDAELADLRQSRRAGWRRASD